MWYHPSPPVHLLLAMDDAIVQLHSWIIVRANCLRSNASSLPPHAYLSGFCIHQLVLWARTNEHTHTLCHVNYYTKCQWTTVVRIFMHLLRVLKRYSMQRQYLHTSSVVMYPYTSLTMVASQVLLCVYCGLTIVCNQWKTRSWNNPWVMRLSSLGTRLGSLAG